MNCKVCGKELRKDAKFCTECGTKVTSEKTSEVKEEVKEEVKKETTASSTTTTVPFNKSKATASLVLGIISLVFGALLLPAAIIGLILGISQKEKCGEKTAGIILNTIAIVISVLAWIVVILFAVIAYNENTVDYESREYNQGSSDIIINDDYNDYGDLDRIEDYFDFNY